MDTDKLLISLKNSGFRVTPVRRRIIEIILQTSEPLNAVEILKALAEQKLEVNKTTVYRELAFLLDEKIIKEVHVTPGITHYESNSLPHHHHLTCTNCGAIEEVNSDDLEKEVEKLSTSVSDTGFRIQKHTLEFYGLCNNCG